MILIFDLQLSHQNAAVTLNPLQCDRHASNLVHHGELLPKPIRFEAKNKSVFSSKKTPALVFVCSPSNTNMPASYNKTAATAESLQQPVGWKTSAALFFFSLSPFPRILRAACSHFFLPKSQRLVTQRQSEKLIISENSANGCARLNGIPATPPYLQGEQKIPIFDNRSMT